MSEYFDEFEGVIWVQPNGPNTEPVPLLCATIDGLDQPLGDVTRRFCRTGSGGIRRAKTLQATPGSITGDIMLWKSRTRNVLQYMVENRANGGVCPGALYIHHGLCGRDDVFLNFITTQVVMDLILTNKSSGNLARGQREENDTPEMVGQTYSASADPFSPEIYAELLNTYLACVAEDEPFRALAICSETVCQSSACGTYASRCDEVHVAADAAGAAIADGYVSADALSSCAAWAAQPFAADEHISALACFKEGPTTEVLIAARGTTDGANPAEIARSIDGGATWTAYDVGSTNGEFVEHSQALFALDHRHIWLATDLANIYFSKDGGRTWTDQNAPTPGASEGLFGIHFVDENYGMAVGGFRTTPTGLFLQTTDGGEHWNLMATEPEVERGNWVQVLDGSRAWVGMDDGTIWYTLNWGTTWTQRVLPETLINTGVGVFYNEYIGAVAGYKTGSGNGILVVYVTPDGGWSWEQFNPTEEGELNAAAAYFGINDLKFCDPNHLIAATEALTTTGDSLIWSIMPAGWTAF